MLPSLAFVPEHEVVDCFNLLMQDFPESTSNVAKYFEKKYWEEIGRPNAENTELSYTHLELE